MSKIREEAEDCINGKWHIGNASSAKHHAKRVLLLEKAYRYRRAAIKLGKYFENDTAWLASNHSGKPYCDDWYWWCIDACELNASILWHKAADLYRQAEEL